MKYLWYERVRWRLLAIWYVRPRALTAATPASRISLYPRIQQRLSSSSSISVGAALLSLAPWTWTPGLLTRDLLRTQVVHLLLTWKYFHRWSRPMKKFQHENFYYKYTTNLAYIPVITLYKLVTGYHHKVVATLWQSCNSIRVLIYGGD